MIRFSHCPRILVVPAVAAILPLSCTQSGRTPADKSLSPGTTPAPMGVRPLSDPDPKDIVRYARTYTYPVHSEPVPAVEHIIQGVNSGIAKGQEPQDFWIAKAIAVKTTEHPSDQEALALVHSDRSYPGLGIWQGDNYIWRDNTSHQVWMASDSPPKKIELVRDVKPYSHLAPEEPHLVFEKFSLPGTAVRTDMIIYGVCLEDPLLCGGHCGYSQ